MAQSLPARGSLPWPRWLSGRVRFALSALTVGGALLAALLSWAILAGFTPLVPTRTLLWGLLALNLLFVLPLFGLVGYRYAVLWLQQGLSGARLHRRMVLLFSVVALVPAALMGVFALLTLDRGLDRWFGARAQHLLETSAQMADIYLSEHQELLRRDAQAMAIDIRQVLGAQAGGKIPEQIASFLDAQIALRALRMAAVIDDSGAVLSASAEWPKDGGDPTPPALAFRSARNGEAVQFTITDKAQLRVLVHLAARRFLYAAHDINPQALPLTSGLQLVSQQYARLAAERVQVQVAFALIYLGAALVILVAANWLGLFVANRLALPIMELMAAAEDVSRGRLSARVPTRESKDEMQKLAQSFNHMVGQLSRQRADLAARHQFTEMVLAGVRSAVVGLDRKGVILHANDYAAKLMGAARARMIGKSLEELSPALAAALARAERSPNLTQQVTYTDKDGNDLCLLLRLVQTRARSEPSRVVTLDDVTELLAAQRIAAWADIARRIAHEIKNPLTPIQLSAERLQSKYGKGVAEPDIFTQCTETIITQVEDIGRMVDEFASFARMPKAVMRRFNCNDIASQAVFLQRVAHPDIEYDLRPCAQPMLEGDSRQFNQALSNLLTNAAEAIDAARQSAKPELNRKHKIVTRLTHTRTQMNVDVSDTGRGFPKTKRSDLIEPYQGEHGATRGLGLAIVQKVMEEHAGRMILDDAQWGRQKYGAQVRLQFPLQQKIKPDNPSLQNGVTT